MGVLDIASAGSVWRGYEYYKNGHVTVWEEPAIGIYTAVVQGSAGACYQVRVDQQHPRTSTCDCPHAKGRRVVCKHMVALYFAAHPDEARRYYEDVVWQEEEEERLRDILDERIEEYLDGLSKQELRQVLLAVLYDGPDWMLDRFVREYVDPFGELL